MGVLDFIKKNILSKFKKQKSLPEGTKDYSNNTITAQSGAEGAILKTEANKEFDDRYAVPYIPKLSTVEGAIQQYVSSILYQVQKGEYTNSYRALTGLCGLDNRVAGNNQNNETNLLSAINNSSKYTLYEQKNKDGIPIFYHVKSGGKEDPADNRIYLNCKRENIANLATSFIQEFGDQPFYFKFDSDFQASKTKRSEQFVFYTHKEDTEQVKNVIRRVREKNPNLFVGSEHNNPFIKCDDGYMACTPEVKTDIYTGLNGKQEPVSRSYNSVLAMALEDSLKTNIRNIVSTDYDLSMKVQGNYYEDLQPYALTVLEDIYKSPEKMKQLVEGMKSSLTQISQRNPVLDIKGINKNRETDRDLAFA